MKKILLIGLLSCILAITGCNNNEVANAVNSSTTEEKIVSEVETPENEEASEPLEEPASGEVSNPERLEEEPKPEISPIDFDFIINGEVNADPIIEYADNILGLLSYDSWKEPKEINPFNLRASYYARTMLPNMDAYQKYLNKDHPKANEQIEIYEIPAKEYEERILTFIDIPVEVLHDTQYMDGSRVYNEEKNVYEIYHYLDAAPTIWAVAEGSGGVTEISKNVYEIVVMFSFDESAPKELGILTVENNDGIPKYLSFIKTEE